MRQDKKQFSFTDHDRDIEINGQVFFATSPLSMSAIEQNLGMDADNLEISGMFTNDHILKSDIESGLFDQAEIVCFEYEWRRNEVNNEIFRGQFTSYSFAQGGFSIEGQTAFGKLNRVFGRGFHRTCDAELGDKKCGLDLEKLGKIYTVEIKSILEFGIEILDIPSVVSGHFESGTVVLFKDDAEVCKLLVKSDEKLEACAEFCFGIVSQRIKNPHSKQKYQLVARKLLSVVLRALTTFTILEDFLIFQMMIGSKFTRKTNE